MKIEDVIKVFKSCETNNNNNNRTIIKYKNNVEAGIELGVVLAKTDSMYEVFIHSKIKNEVISQILYSTYDNEEEGKEYYNKLEQYITNFNLEGIVDEIKKGNEKGF